jgi:hypothetical protein
LYWNNYKYPYPRWTDVRINTHEFIRTLGELKYHIENGTVKHFEKHYNFQDMIMGSTDKKHNTKIGTIDFETFGDNSLKGGLGNLSVFAGAVALNDGYYESYIIDKSQGLNDGNDIINKIFFDLFNYISTDKKKRNCYTLYAHNLGRFDSVFILKGLSNSKYDVKCLWMDNDVLSVKIRDKDRKLSVTLKDSIKLVPTSLNKMLKTYNCTINKGLFPHKFVTKDNLNYIGYKPLISDYFDGHNLTESNILEYNNLPDTFNLKSDCLKYLESDVLGLLEAMNKISLYYFSNFNFNITKFNTLPSIALAIFGFGYQKCIHTIKMVKGPLEKFIRQAYFGGNSNIFVDKDERFVSEGYHYDMNSQFPYAMKNEMPTGNPVFTNNIDLDYYKLGFVFAKITPPTKDILPNLFLQCRDVNGSVTCPRDVFYEYISTVDLRQGIEYGYKAEIICGVNFPDSCLANELFGEFVNKFYEIKSKAMDSVSKNISKLILNSTYGKFGQRDHEYTIKLLDKKEKDKVIKKYHYSYLTELNDNLFIIKTGPKLNEKLRKLYKEQFRFELIDNDNYKLSKDRGIPSAVQISAIISAYARFSINPLKNIIGNLAIASNTDSLILRKPLPDHLIGDELGKWKLEHKFKNGIFVKPKLYCYEDQINNKLIRKASGIVAAKLTYNDYSELAKGNNIITNNTVFKLNWKKLGLEVVNVEYNINGLNNSPSPHSTAPQSTPPH